jgi:hypothetical protein
MKLMMNASSIKMMFICCVLIAFVWQAYSFDESEIEKNSFDGNVMNGKVNSRFSAKREKGKQKKCFLFYFLKHPTCQANFKKFFKN